MKLKINKCKICQKSTSYRGFSQHINKCHNLKIEEYIVTYEYNGIHPKCKCGCGQNVTIRVYDVMDYVVFHSPGGKFKKGESPNRDYEKWKTNLKLGIKKYNQTQKDINPEYRSGINNNFYGKMHSDKTKQKIRQSVEKQILLGKHAFIGNHNGRLKKSSLEIKFEKILIEYKINYVHNYKIGFYKDTNYKKYKYYDFYLPNLNKLIEIHGLYWHPKNMSNNLNEIQRKNYENDLFKKDLAIKNGYILDIVYDYELDNYIDSLTNFNRSNSWA